MKILRSTVLFLFIALAATAFFGCESTTGPDQVDGAVVSLSIQGTRPAILADEAWLQSTPAP